MYNKNLIIAGLIALSLHAALIMMSPNVTSEPEVIFRKGESSLKMNLVPSVASTASAKHVIDEQDDVQKVEKIIDNTRSLQKLENKKVVQMTVTKSINDVQKPVLKTTDKKTDKPVPLSKPEDQREKKIKAEDSVAKTEKEITYSAEYFKAQKEIKSKQSQMQKNNSSILDSEEIIADVKAKGVTKGAMVENVFKPSYPSSCKRQGHEGTTVLEVTILSKSKCGNIEIIKSAGCESLDKAAIKALKRAKYISAKRLGVPFTTAKKIAFNFKLEDYQLK